MLSGGDGIIYAIDQNGRLFFYKDLARDGKSVWANGGSGKQIGTGWPLRLPVISGDLLQVRANVGRVRQGIDAATQPAYHSNIQ